MNILIRKFSRALPKNQFVRSVALLAGGTALGQVLVVLVTPLLTRIYTPQDFGLFAIYSSVISLLLVLASFRYELAIPLSEDEEVAANLGVLSVVILMVVVTITCIACLIFGKQLVWYLNVPSFEPYLWILPLSLLGAGTYQILNYWAVRLKSFDQLAQTKLSQSLGQIVTQLVFGIMHITHAGLLVGDMIGRFGGSSTLATLVLRQDRTVFSNVSLASLKKVGKRYAKFPLVTTWASLINVASLQVPIVLLATYFDVVAVGYYLLAQRVLGTPSSLIGQAVGQVFFSDGAELRADPAKLKSLIERLAVALFAIGLPLFGVVTISGSYIFEAIFGEQWKLAGRYAQILSPWFLFWLVSSPLSNILIVREKQASSLVFTVFEFVSRVLAICVGAYYQSYIVALCLLAISGVLISIASIERFLCAGYSKIFHVLRPVLRLIIVTMPMFFLLIFATYMLTLPKLILVFSMLTIVINYLLILRFIPELNLFKRR